MRLRGYRGPVLFGLSIGLALLLAGGVAGWGVFGGTFAKVAKPTAAPEAAALVPLVPPVITGDLGANTGLQIDDLDNNPNTVPEANVTTGGVTDTTCSSTIISGEVDSNCPQVTPSPVTATVTYVDWNTVPNRGPGKYVLLDKPSGNTDDSFGGTGTTSCLQPDHGAPAKEDILRVYLANGPDIFYVGLVDASPSGDSRHIVLLHKNQIDKGEKCAGNGNILRLKLTTADRIIRFTFHPSAETVAQIYQPVATLDTTTSFLLDEASNFADTTKWQPVTSDAVKNVAVNQNNAIANDVLGGGVSVPADTFGELAASFQALGIPACGGGTYNVSVITRSSGSGGGTAKDFVGGAFTFPSISVTAALTPSCDPTNFGFGFSAQAKDIQNNNIPDNNVNYSWSCNGGATPTGKSGNEIAAAGNYTCTVTAQLLSNTTCTAQDTKSTVVLNPITVTITPDNNSLACTAPTSPGSDQGNVGVGVTFTPHPSGGTGTYSLTWNVGGPNAASCPANAATCLVDIPDGTFCALSEVSVTVDDTGTNSNLCPAVTSETEQVIKNTTINVQTKP